MTHPLGWTLGMSAFTPSTERGGVPNGDGREQRGDRRPRGELRRMHREVHGLQRRRSEARSLRAFFHPFGVVTLSPDWQREREKRTPGPKAA